MDDGLAWETESHQNYYNADMRKMKCAIIELVVNELRRQCSEWNPNETYGIWSGAHLERLLSCEIGREEIGELLTDLLVEDMRSQVAFDDVDSTARELEVALNRRHALGAQHADYVGWGLEIERLNRKYTWKGKYHHSRDFTPSNILRADSSSWGWAGVVDDPQDVGNCEKVNAALQCWQTKVIKRVLKELGAKDLTPD